jgi:hypothetical protein
MDLHVASGAVGILSILIVLGTGRFDGAYFMLHTVAGQAQLIHLVVPQQSRISGAMRSMAGGTALGFEWGVFVSEWTLFVRMALNARGIGASGQPHLL